MDQVEKLQLLDELPDDPGGGAIIDGLANELADLHECHDWLHERHDRLHERYDWLHE